MNANKLIIFLVTIFCTLMFVPLTFLIAQKLKWKSQVLPVLMLWICLQTGHSKLSRVACLSRTLSAQLWNLKINQIKKVPKKCHVLFEWHTVLVYVRHFNKNANIIELLTRWILSLQMLTWNIAFSLSVFRQTMQVSVLFWNWSDIFVCNVYRTFPTFALFSLVKIKNLSDIQ